MNISVNDILKLVDGELVFGSTDILCENFSKDTRTINEGDVYVGIKGENFDGNSLYKNALENGAKVCILQGVNGSEIKELENTYSDRAIILVEDTIKALQKIASYKRDLYNIPVIAITGSVGKTSTKDIVASVVATEYNVLKTQGNLNNHIGLPMTILGLKNHTALVVEMGMNNLGEISVLSNIAKPNIAIITNVGTSHIGNLGSRENILKAKLEILEGLKDNGILIINNDNDMLNNWLENSMKTSNNEGCYNVENNGKNVKVYTYGIENSSNIMASNINLKEDSSEFEIILDNKKEDITVPVGGNHFVYNALCATLAGKVLGISIDKIKLGIQKFELSKNRMELINLSNNVTVINDCYNANYDSMKASIEYLAKTNATRKIAVLGDMLELGEFSQELHTKVGDEISRNKIDILITVGDMGKVISNTAKSGNIQTYHCKENEDAVILIKNIMQKNDIILVKASNGMKFKEIVEGLKK